MYAKMNATRAIEIELGESGSYRYWYLVTSVNPYSFPLICYLIIIIL